MSAETEMRNPVGEFLIGLQDCIMSLGVSLANRGVLSREEIAAAFEETLAQQKSRPDCQSPARQMPVEALAKVFRMRTYCDDDLPC